MFATALTTTSALTATGVQRRIGRLGPQETRRLRRVQNGTDVVNRVSVYAVAEEVDCDALLGDLRRVRRPAGDWQDAILEDSVHSRLHESHVFVFDFGIVVTWGFARRDELSIVSGLSDYLNGTVLAEAHDTMSYKIEGSFGCKRDLIRLVSDDKLELFSVSYAMAQSAKLFVFEARVATTIDEIQDIPSRLATTGKTDLTAREISQMIGKVFLERARVNLASDILDSPDYLWEDDLHEPKYRRIYEWLDVPDRVALLNDRLTVMGDLLEVLNTQLANKHSSKLELIIISLIVVEIIVTVVTFAFDRFMIPFARSLFF